MDYDHKQKGAAYLTRHRMFNGPIGAKIDDPYAMYLNDVYTLPASVAGLPGLSLPCGLSEGLPVGLQIIGNFFDEGRILRAAYAFESALGWSNRLPELA